MKHLKLFEFKSNICKNEIEHSITEITSAIKKGKAEIKKLYDEYEENNEHSNNVLLMAMSVGSEYQIKKAKEVCLNHCEHNSLSTANKQERDELYNKLIDKFDELLYNKIQKNGKMTEEYNNIFSKDLSITKTIIEKLIPVLKKDKTYSFKDISKLITEHGGVPAIHSKNIFEIIDGLKKEGFKFEE